MNTHIIKVFKYGLAAYTENSWLLLYLRRKKGLTQEGNSGDFQHIYHIVSVIKICELKKTKDLNVLLILGGK